MASTTPVPDVAAVLAENHRRFLTFLARRVPTREIAEDILQGAFVRGLTRAPALATTESVMAWFYRVLRNAIVDHYRRAGAESRAMERYAAEIDDAVAPLDTELLDVLCGCVRSLVTTLKPEYAAAITRVELDGATLAEFAKEGGHLVEQRWRAPAQSTANPQGAGERSVFDLRRGWLRPAHVRPPGCRT